MFKRFKPKMLIYCAIFMLMQIYLDIKIDYSNALNINKILGNIYSTVIAIFISDFFIVLLGDKANKFRIPITAFAIFACTIADIKIFIDYSPYRIFLILLTVAFCIIVGILYYAMTTNTENKILVKIKSNKLLFMILFYSSMLILMASIILSFIEFKHW